MVPGYLCVAHSPDGDKVLRAKPGRIVAVLDLLLVGMENLVQPNKELSDSYGSKSRREDGI